MYKKHVTLIVLCLVVIALISIWDMKSDYHEQTPLGAYNKTEEDFIDFSSSVIPDIYELNPNTNLYLTQGQRIVYAGTTPLASEQETYYEHYTYSVEFGRLDKRNVYIVRANMKKIYGVPDAIKYAAEGQNFTVYIDKETGGILRLRVGNKEGKDNSALMAINMLTVTGEFFYSPWMLGLEKDKEIKWHDSANMSDPLPQESFIEYELAGNEKIGDRECFKVKTNLININKLNDEKTTFNSIMWIDTQKRIVVRSEVYLNNILMKEIKLISEK